MSARMDGMVDLERAGAVGCFFTGAFGGFGGGRSGALEDALVCLLVAGALRLDDFLATGSSSDVSSVSGELKGPGVAFDDLHID
jgi:hypothetical protein